MRQAFCPLMALLLAAGPVGADPVAAPAPRQETSLDAGWRFHRGDAGEGAARAGFDDGGWQRIDVPHSWNRIGSYTTTRDPKTDLGQGIGWYRRHLILTASAPGTRHYLQFDGVGTVADVWLNGHLLGRHAGAFSRFRFDATDLLHPGNNVIAVRADNSKRSAESTTGAVIPLAGDFFLFGGIYRHAALIDVGPAHFDLLDDAGPGVYATTTGVTSGTATVAVRARIEAPQGDVPEVVLALDDAEGHSVAEQRVPASLLDGRTTIAATLVVPQVHLWNGRADPYLYRLRAEVRVRDAVTDRLDQTFGIRTFRLDAEQGFFLNDRHLPLHGVSRHQDRLGAGWAVSDADQRQDMALIAELGANAVRGAHYQHAPIWYDLADRYGMAMWAEVPFVNQAGWRRAAGLDPAILTNAEQQTRELIKQNYNHPSIVTWSVGNETDIVDLGSETRPNSRAMLAALAGVARALDPSRPTAFADCCEPNDALADPRPVSLAGITQTIGYNRYSGWYYDKATDLGPNLDRLHQRHAGIPLAVTEYGAGGALGEHTDDPRGGPIDSHGRTQPEEYQSWVLEQNWRAIAARPYLWASWLWTMFDFASPRAEGDSSDLNTKGLMTADRKTRKDAFYFYKAQWSRDPVLHITSSRYVDRFYPVTDVRLYSNAPSVRLSLNGRDLGQQPCGGGICVWPRVALTAGQNRLIATARIAGREIGDSVTWTAPDPSIGLALDAGTLLGSVASNGTRFGSDAFFDGGEAAALETDPAEAAGLDPAMGRSIRRGSFRYDLPVPNGRWSLSLWFAAPRADDTGEFSVIAQGDPVLSRFDVAQAAGGVQRLVRRDFPVAVHDGHLRLDFRAGTGPALLSALRVTPLERPND